jgi:hypothetical protein
MEMNKFTIVYITTATQICNLIMDEQANGSTNILTYKSQIFREIEVLMTKRSNSQDFIDAISGLSALLGNMWFTAYRNEYQLNDAKQNLNFAKIALFELDNLMQLKVPRAIIKTIDAVKR